MLVIESEDRFSARRCLQVGCDKCLFKACSDGSIMDNVDCLNGQGDFAADCGKRTLNYAKKPPFPRLEGSKWTLQVWGRRKKPQLRRHAPGRRSARSRDRG